MLTMPHLTEMLCSWLFFTVSSSCFYTSLFSGFFPKQLSPERLSPPPQSYTLSSIQWMTLWKINEAVFSGCFLGGQNVSKKWTDPSVALEHRQLNLQLSKLTGTFGQVKTSKYFSHTTTSLCSLHKEQCPGGVYSTRNKGCFPLVRWGLWSPLQGIFCPLLLSWKNLCRRNFRTTVGEKPLTLKEKSFLGFQCSLLYAKCPDFPRLHSTAWRAAAGREQNGLFEMCRLES